MALLNRIDQALLVVFKLRQNFRKLFRNSVVHDRVLAPGSGN